MAYGSIKVDTIVFTNGGSDASVTVSGLSASTSGNLTVTGIVSGNTANFVSGNFSSLISGATVNFISGNFSTRVSGAAATIGVATITSGVFPAGSVTAPSVQVGTGTTYNPGIYSPAIDQIAISANGVQQLLIDTANVSCKNLVLKANTPEGGQLQLNNPTDTGVVYYFDVVNATNARIFTVSNNTNLDIGQLSGTGGNIKFSTESTEKIRLASNGSICINTTDSTGKVNIAPTGSRTIGSAWDTSSVLIGTPGAYSANLGLSFDATNGAVIEAGTPGITTYPIHLYGSILKFSASGTERIRVSSTGAVGFGTTTPTTSIGFPIAQNTSIGAVAGTPHSSGNAGSITLGIQDGSALSGITIYNTHNGTHSSQDIRFTTAQGGITATTERMRITNDGKVGIGISSPYSGVLTVAAIGATPATVATANQINIGEATLNSNYRLQVGYFYDTQGRGSIQSYDNANPATLILNGAGGNVGIGTSLPGQALDIKGSVRSSIGTGTGAGGAGYALYQFGTSATATENWHIGSEGDGSFRFYNQGIGAGLERFRITSTGLIGIGTSSPGAPLDIVCAGQATSSLNTTGSFNLLVSETGGVVSSGGSLVFGAAAGTSNWRFAAIKGLVTNGGGNSQGDLVFLIRPGAGDSTLSEAMRIDSTGLITIAGPGIKFPATQVASADANTLDDYEEGTWTPNVGGTATYNASNYGRYTKIGNVVTCQFKIYITTLGTGSVTTLQGLPFVSANIADVQTGAVSYYQDLAVNTIFVAFYVDNNATTAVFVGKSASGATVDNSIPLFGNGAIIYGTVTYRTV